MNTQERKNRIIARGEHSNHSHVIVGDAQITRNENGEVLVEVGNEGAVLRHLLESEWLAGNEVWTKEHKDIELDPGKYKYIPQVEFDPYEEKIREVQD